MSEQTQQPLTPTVSASTEQSIDQPAEQPAEQAVDQHEIDRATGEGMPDPSSSDGGQSSDEASQESQASSEPEKTVDQILAERKALIDQATAGKKAEKQTAKASQGAQVSQAKSAASQVQPAPGPDVPEPADTPSLADARPGWKLRDGIAYLRSMADSCINRNDDPHGNAEKSALDACVNLLSITEAGIRQAAAQESSQE